MGYGPEDVKTLTPCVLAGLRKTAVVAKVLFRMTEVRHNVDLNSIVIKRGEILAFYINMVIYGIR